VHGWNIKIHPESVIGARVGIMHDVTLGTNMERPGAPVIGDDVFIGAGARIIGGVHIGNGARIAANSLVIGDVPAGATAIGVPARVMQYTGRPPPSSSPPSSPPSSPSSPPPPEPLPLFDPPSLPSSAKACIPWRPVTGATAATLARMSSSAPRRRMRVLAVGVVIAMGCTSSFLSAG